MALEVDEMSWPREKKVRPLLVLFFLPSLLVELTSGNMPPSVFFPLSFVVFPMYGCGVVLVRELVARWGKGWPSVMVLGFAYGLCEEGLMLKTCFRPKYGDEFQRFFGVNWQWTVDMNLWHALYSVALPILLVHLIFPRHRESRWLGPRGFSIFTFVFVGVGAFIYLALDPYQQPVGMYVLFVLVVVLLIALARVLPRSLATRVPMRRPVRPLYFAGLGFVVTPLFYILSPMVKGAGAPPFIMLLTTPVFLALVALLLIWMSGGGAWNAWHQYALGTGAFAPYILGAAFAPVWTLPGRWTAPFFWQMLPVGILAGVFFIWVGLRLRRIGPEGLVPMYGQSRPAGATRAHVECGGTAASEP